MARKVTGSTLASFSRLTRAAIVDKKAASDRGCGAGAGEVAVFFATVLSDCCCLGITTFGLSGGHHLMIGQCNRNE
jgi:hypothetical protein